jgi:hypothetical protein
MHHTTKITLQEFIPSFFGYYRQFDKECSPFARFAFGVYPATMLGYNAVADAKPQPGAPFF